MALIDAVAALRDLFAHYMEAWKSWYIEVAGNIKIPRVS